MARTTRNSRAIARSQRKLIRRTKDATLLEICTNMYKAASKNGKRVPYRYVTNLVTELKPTSP